MTNKLILPRTAVAAAFFVNGAGFASWVVRIPEVRDRIGLTESGLGLALLGVAVGALIAMPLAGGMITRLGSRPIYRMSAMGFAGAIALAGSSATQVSLTLALVLLGAANSAVSVSLNTQAAAIERGVRRPVISGLHALYSLGALFGAGLGGLVASQGIPPVVHLVGGAMIMAVVSLLAAPGLLPPRVDVRPGAAKFARPTRRLLLLGAVAFCVLFGEGAAANWAAVYLRDITGAGAGLAAAGFAVFSMMMACGRLTGDPLVRRFGAVKLLRAGGLLAGAGVAITVASVSARAGLVGLAALGAGLSIIYPALMGLVGRLHSAAPAPAVAAVSMMGYVGFLAGPALIGVAAEAISLRGAFALVGGTSLMIVGLAGLLPLTQPAARGAAGHSRAEPRLARSAA
jgi:MFS family permease